MQLYAWVQNIYMFSLYIDRYFSETELYTIYRILPFGISQYTVNIFSTNTYILASTCLISASHPLFDFKII